MADGLEDAFIGWVMIKSLSKAHGPVCCYDYERMVRVLVDRDGMTEEDAEEFLGFNTLGAYVGDDGPAFLVRIPWCEVEEKPENAVLLPEFEDAFIGWIECKALLNSDGQVACYDWDKMLEAIIARRGVTAREASLYLLTQQIPQFTDGNDPVFFFEAPLPAHKRPGSQG